MAIALQQVTHWSAIRNHLERWHLLRAPSMQQQVQRRAPPKRLVIPWGTRQGVACCARGQEAAELRPARRHTLHQGCSDDAGCWCGAAHALL